MLRKFLATIPASISPYFIVSSLLIAVVPFDPVLAQAPDSVWLDTDEPVLDPDASSPSTQGDLNIPSPGFVRNSGQLDDPDVLYYTTSGKGGVLFYASRLTYYQISGGKGDPEREDRSCGSESVLGLNDIDPTSSEVSLITLEFTDSNRVTPEGIDQTQTRLNFLLGNDPSRWQRNVPAFEEIVYRGLYDGIDIVYYLKDGGFKYDILLSPGADPSIFKIGLMTEGIIEIMNDSMVTIVSNGWTVFDSNINAFYGDGDAETVPCRFRKLNAKSYGFDIGNYDINRPLVIDPMVYSTYIGGSMDDVAIDVDVDDNEYVYIVGMTKSADFPIVNGTMQSTYSGGVQDAFLCKLNRMTGTPVFMTFLGGNSSDKANSLKVDDNGDIFVTGYTSSEDFPIEGPGYSQTKNGGNDAFLTKVDSNGSSLIYMTFLGDSASDVGQALDIDPEGYAYVVGITRSVYFPRTPGCFQSSFRGDSHSRSESFISKISPDGTRLVYSSFLGGKEDDIAYDIVIDPNHLAHVTGETHSTDFSTTEDAYQTTLAGFSCFFYSVVSSDGKSLSYSTFIGGSGWDGSRSIALDMNGDVYLGGFSQSSDFPVTNGAFQEDLDTGSSGVVLEFNRTESAVIFSTYLHPPTENKYTHHVHDLVINRRGQILITGQTDSDEMPVSPCADQRNLGGAHDAFLALLSDDGSSLVYSTYFGGKDIDFGNAIAIDDEDRAALVGETMSNDFPVTSDAFQQATSGSDDAFVLFLPPDLEPPVSSTMEPIIVDQHTTVRLDGSNSTDNVGIANWTWTFEYGGDTQTLHGPSPSFTFHEAGEYLVTLNVTDATGNWANATVGVTVVDTTPPVAVAGDDIVVDQGEIFTLDGTASSDNVAVASWTWSLVYDGKEVSLHGAELEYAIGVVGEYVVTLTIADRRGNTANDTITVTVLDTTAPTAEAGSDIEAGTGEEVVFDGSASSDNVGIASWNWTFAYGDDIITLVGETASYDFQLPGVYVVKLEVVDASGLRGTDSMTVTVLDDIHPVADAGEDREVGQGTLVSLDGSGSSDNVGVVGWTWTLVVEGDEVTLDGEETAYRFDVPGTYAVDLTVEDAAGNRASDQVVVTVLDTEPPVAVTRGDAEVEENTSLLLDASNSTDNVGIVTYDWTIEGPGGTETEHGSTVTHLFATSGPYTVRLVVGDGAGNTDETSLEVVVTRVGDTNGNGNGGGDSAMWYGVISAIVVIAVLVSVLALRRRGRTGDG